MPPSLRRPLIIGVVKVAAAVLGLLLLGIGLDLLFSLPRFPSFFGVIAGLGTLVGALALEGWGTYTLWAEGKGTPNPAAPPRRLVSIGPYSVSRNPLYVARITVLLAASVIGGSLGILVVALGLFATLHFVLLPREERRLAARFGKEYAGYVARVRRWIGRPSSMAEPVRRVR